MVKTKANAKAKDQKKLSAKRKSKQIKKSAPAEGGVKEKRKIKWKIGTVVLREIKRYQKSNKLILPRTSFQKLVKAICEDFDHELRWQAHAISAL